MPLWSDFQDFWQGPRWWCWYVRSCDHAAHTHTIYEYPLLVRRFYNIYSSQPTTLRRTAWCAYSHALPGTHVVSIYSQNIDVILRRTRHQVQPTTYTRHRCLEYQEIPSFLLMGHREIPRTISGNTGKYRKRFCSRAGK